MSWILHSILAEVLLYIRVAMRLAAGCQPGDTCGRWCFVLADEMCFAEEVVVTDAAVADALALRAHVPIDEDVLLRVVVLSELLFPVRFAAYDLGSFHHHFPSGQVFLHEAQTLILLALVHEIVFDDCFDLFIQVLLQILLSFSLLALRVMLNA
jgi:hypothetical protein